MSFEGIRKRRRCIVQKLDFENCIVTNFKTGARGRKKLRARITREFENFTEIPEQPCQESAHVSPITTQCERSSSPVLIRKQRRNVDSPALNKRQKTNSPEDESEELLEHSTIEEIPSSPGSPVFRTFKKPKKANRSNVDKTTNPDIFHSQESSSSGITSSFQIEEFTQESKQSVKISSVESPVLRTDSSSSCSVGADAKNFLDSPTSNCFNVVERCESPKPLRRNYKKNSLLGRLHKLQQKQASEKLLWKHQNRKISTNTLTVSVVTFWKEEFNYYLKCQSSDLESTFLIIDSRWVPNVRNVKEGSLLQLHPPWQKLVTEDSKTTIVLSIICLDVLDEIREPILLKKRFDTIPSDQFQTDRKLFVDSLFSTSGCGFLI